MLGRIGNIGEGHIHLNVIYDNGEEVEVSARNLVSQILKEIVSIRETITSEQGAGDAKSEFACPTPPFRRVGLELAPHEIEIMKSNGNTVNINVLTYLLHNGPTS